MTTNPYGAYQKQQKQEEDPRIVDAKALLRMVALLEEAQNPQMNYADYSEAVKANQNLWTLFQASLVEESNQLPEKLKDILKSLSIYVDRRSLRAIGTQDPKLLNILININKDIAAGLMESVKNFPAATNQIVPSAAPLQGAFVGEQA